MTESRISPTSFEFSERDRYFMRRALQLAATAASHSEVPVGAVAVLDDEIIGEGFNCPIESSDPSCHAEIIAIRQACQHLNNYRLPDVRLYVSLEPCPMCAAAMVHARVKQVIYAAADYKTGACHSVMNFFEHPSHNHHVDAVGGLMAEEGGSILSNFFKQRRAEIKQQKSLK